MPAIWKHKKNNRTRIVPCHHVVQPALLVPLVPRESLRTKRKVCLIRPRFAEREVVVKSDEAAVHGESYPGGPQMVEVEEDKAVGDVWNLADDSVGCFSR